MLSSLVVHSLNVSYHNLLSLPKRSYDYFLVHAVVIWLNLPGLRRDCSLAQAYIVHDALDIRHVPPGDALSGPLLSLNW